eukprot:PhF_6_TR28068/c0_g1_i3/m.41454
MALPPLHFPPNTFGTSNRSNPVNSIAPGPQHYNIVTEPSHPKGLTPGVTIPKANPELYPPPLTNRPPGGWEYDSHKSAPVVTIPHTARVPAMLENKRIYHCGRRFVKPTPGPGAYEVTPHPPVRQMAKLGNSCTSSFRAVRNEARNGNCIIRDDVLLYYPA